MDPGPRDAPLPTPPPGSGIVVEPTPGGARVALPRLFAAGDVIVAVLAGAVAVWMAVWVDAVAADPGATLLGVAPMGLVGLVFGAIAVTQGLPVLAPRVIEDAGDRLVLSRRIGAQRVLHRSIPKAAIRSVEWTWDHNDPDDPGLVEIRADGRVYPVGKHLDVAAVEWLEAALRRMTAV